MSRTPSTLTLAAVTAIGGLSLVTGAAFVRRPDLARETIPEVLAIVEGIDPGHALLAVLVALLVLAPAQGLANRIHAERPRSLTEATADDTSTPNEPPLAVRRQLEAISDDSTASTPVIGGDLEGAVERATDYDRASRRDREAARDVLVSTLRPVAAAAYARQTGVDRDRALEDVEAGVWTDDVRAGAFLASEEGRSTPIAVWLFDLFTATDPFRRGLAHTIDAIETLQSDPEVVDS